MDRLRPPNKCGPGRGGAHGGEAEGGHEYVRRAPGRLPLPAAGLDTIYLFSDGLPNIGDGVPDAKARRTLETGREPELSGRLAKHIRKTLKTAWNRDTGTDRVRINAVGFFYESPDVGAFLWALARENEGSFVGMSKP